MADDVQDIAIYTGSEWTSLSELAAGVVDAKLPIESVDATVKLDGNASVFTVSTGNAGQIRLEPGATSNNYLRVYDTGSPNGAMLCARNSVSNGFTVRPFKETVTGNAFSCFNLLWDYTASTVDFTNPAKKFELIAYNAPSPACKGDRYYAFNVGGITPQTDFTLAAGLHLNVADNIAADKEAYNILVEGTAPSRFASEIQTPSVRGLADNDAEVTLGGNLVVNTGGSQSVIVTQEGRVGFGATPASSVQFQNTASASTGMRSDITHNSSTRYAYSDGQLMVTTAAATADIAIMSGCRVVGKSSVGATVDQYYGIYVAEAPAGAVASGAFRSALNGDGADEGKSSVNGVFNVYADGNAPNYFGGDVRITPTKKLNVSKIVGAGAPDTDASVTLGVQATLTKGDGSEYVPTDSASIATKKIVDDKIWVGTTASYNAIATKNPTTLYCLTD